MPHSLRFPLYIFRSAGSSNVVFKERDGEKQLPLFTSAENANDYRNGESMDVQITRLTTPSELRDLLLDHRESFGEFKIAMDPTYALTESRLPIL